MADMARGDREVAPVAAALSMLLAMAAAVVLPVSWIDRHPTGIKVAALLLLGAWLLMTIAMPRRWD